MGSPSRPFYRWKEKYGSLNVDEARRLQLLEDENRRLKHLVADLTLDNQALRAVIIKKPNARRTARGRPEPPAGVRPLETPCVRAAGGVTLVAPASAQVGTQLVVTMNLAAPVKAIGGSYYIAFTVDDTIITGPQSDSSNWTHYLLYRQGRFFFGRVPTGAFRPFGFEAIRPPDPYPFGEVSPDRRTLRVRFALTDLQVGATLPLQVKVNLVTVNDEQRPLDALGSGAADRFGFATLDLRRGTYLAMTDPAGDASDPGFDIVGGDIQAATP